MSFLSVQSVTRSFGDFRAIDRVSFDVPAGALLSLVGPSGCGKSTTLRAIAGLAPIDSGEIHVEGEPIEHLPPESRPTAMVFQSYAVWPHMTVAENIGFGLKLRGKPKATVAREVQGLLNLVDLGELGKRYPSELSGGQRQRVALARALAVRPKVLLLDEPMSNLDPQLRYRVRDEIKALQRRLRMTTVLVTHDQEEAMAVSDHIVVMDRGMVIQTGTPEQVFQKPASPFVANFMGATNKIRAVLTSVGPTSATVNVGEQKIVGSLVAPLAVGSAVDIVFRPSAVRVAAQSVEPNVCLKFLEASYRGYNWNWKASLEGVPLHLEVPREVDRPAPTHIFAASIAPSDLFIYPALQA